MSPQSRRAVLRCAGGALAGVTVVRVSRLGGAGGDRAGGARADTATATPRAAPTTPAVEFDAQRVGDGGRRVVVERAVLPDGGFVAIHEGGPTGPTVGSTGHLPPGIHRHVAVTVEEQRRVTDRRELTAALWRDSDGDGTSDVVTGEDRPYLVGDEPVYDTALVFPPTPTPEPTPEPAFTETAVSLATTTPTPPPSPTSSPTVQPTAGGVGAVPGFGVVAAVVAVAAGAGAVTAWRRG